MKRSLAVLTALSFLAIPAFGQQTGSISGRITLPEGDPVPGATIEARSDVLPQPRVTVTDEQGAYSLPLLPPGVYDLTISLEGMTSQERRVQVLLQQTSTLDVVMSASLEESVEVIGTALLVDPSSAELKAAIGQDVIDPLPVGQNYRDLVKLIPGVQYTEDDTRGPSAGGSGQDNVYLFDGVSVALPLFGNLSAEPSSHDIDQISIVKGGANAVDFNRSGGFTINSISKTGTNRYRAEASYQVQTEDMTADREPTVGGTTFEEDRSWAILNGGGPVWRDRMYFYASYFRPTIERDNRSNAYGDVPTYESERDELFGKLTYSPTNNISIHGSYRDSDREVSGDNVGGFSAASTSEGSDITLKVATLEGSWVINSKSYASFRYTDFENQNSSRPDNLFGFSIASGQRLDVANLDQQGRFQVPRPIAGATAYNNFIASLIERYGYLENGVRTGGGFVGGARFIDDNDFARESIQGSYDYLLGSNVTHELHFGYQWTKDEEDLSRQSNGWGLITVPGGRATFNGQPVFYQAELEQMSLVGPDGSLVPAIHSEFESQSIELNDVIKWDRWAVNVGVLLSNDTYYGQGLRPNSSNVSGFELALGNKYKMYEIDFEDMIQPRLGAVWTWNGRDTVYANYARYYPAASSLPRAASWDRNLARTIRAYFAADGSFIGLDPIASSSGKFFDDDLDPRSIDEFLLGTAFHISPNWTARVHGRYRYGANFWEDTNNDARIAFNPPEGVDRELYVPNLAVVRGEIGGSSYVIAELDGAFTKYYEVGAEAEWRGSKAYFRGSYVWSHYYGNFDQDNSTTANDANVFIGSSFIADGAGRQIWDNKYGNLRGDRRHQLKLYGYYRLPWNATTGAYAIYQSGQPYEVWDVEVYRALTSSTSDVNRYAEPAGSRTTDAHYQIDLNYTQTFTLGGRYALELRADVYNVTDNQTGYNIQNQRSLAGFLGARSVYDPRRFQLGVKFSL